jgi:hypothetical protein
MRRDFDEHSDDALHLSALGRSDDPIGPLAEHCGLTRREMSTFVDLTHSHWVQIQREQKRIERRRRWKRTAATFGWLTLVLAAAALLIIGSAT